MTIAIIGCGAMGSLFGARLARAGHVVWMVDNHAERARIIASEGIRVEAPDGEFRADVHATTDVARVPAPDVVLVFVKAYATSAAAETAARLAGARTALVTLQNGLGNIATLTSRFGPARVIGGATGQGATEIAPGRIRYAGIGPTVIAEASGQRTTRIETLADALRGAGFEVEITADLDSAIWSKLVINCGINAVGALTRLPNGALADDPGAVEVLRAAASEAAAVARAKGIRLAYDDPGTHTQEVCRSTAKNVNSMLQDVLRGRRTEVDAINGAVAREGEASGVPAPVNAALAALVGAIERGYPRQLSDLGKDSGGSG